MNYAQIKNCDIANGPGVRVSLFVSGCPHRCPGCFNAEAWDFGYGQPFTQQVQQTLLELLRPGHIRGLTLLGGEPFAPENQAPVLEFLQKMKKAYPQKTVWAYTGYLFDRDLLSGRCGDKAVTQAYLSHIDVLVDGPFIQQQKDLTLRFRGSSNQRIIDVPASLACGSVVLWEDWQHERRGMQ